MSCSFNPLDHPVLFSSPRRLTPVSAWHEHIPFAMFLVGFLRPNVFVELGTHCGDSYCAFCQAVQELNLGTRCYAIDNWEGDSQSGFYGPDVLEDLRKHHDPLYGSFSSLIKTTFDDALGHFSNGSIELLHIDGCHTYEVVRHDFESWFPKMSPRGIVLFHDTNVREKDFGVWKFWEEIKQRHAHFEFVHGHGLGVLAVAKFPESARALFGASLEDTLKIRNFFFHVGQRIASNVEHVAQFSAERERFAVQAREQALAQKEAEADQLASQLQSALAQLQNKVRSDQEVLAQKEKELTQLVAERERLGQETSQLQASLRTREAYVTAIEGSLAWILLVKYRRLRDKLCAEGTRRRMIYNSAKEFCKKLVQGRTVALQSNRVDLYQSAKYQQSISLPVDLPEWIPPSSEVKSILPRPEALVLAKLSVVIPTKNGMSEGFESTLSAICRQRGIAETEIIVVDSGSSDGTVEAAKSYGAKVFSIAPEEFNHGATRNYGAGRTTGELLLFTVQDAIPSTDDLFYEMAKSLIRDPKLAGVSVRQVAKSDADLYACWERWNHNRFHLDVPIEKLGISQEISTLPVEDLLRLAGLDNVCSMIKRDIWEKIRFKPTEYAEDLEFGLSCLREGYKIRWLSHRSTVHSHTRRPFYYMSRHYVDRRVMHELLKDRSPEWVDAITPDQLFSAVKASYLAINEFVASLEVSSMHDPRLVLRELVSYVSARYTSTSEIDAQSGEPSLSKFFVALESRFSSDLPQINPCIQNYQGTVQSLLEFIGDRYPRMSGSELKSVIYKAYAGVAGRVFGSFCFGGSREKVSSTQFKCLDDFLAKGYRE